MNDSSGASISTPPAIALTGVNLALGSGVARVHILKDIDLHIGRGEAVGMVGPSGSGKSTLLMVMAGLERPDTGRILVNGRDLGTLGEDALARYRGRHIGIVFQSFHLIPTMTAVENVAVALELAGVAEAFDIAARELDAVGLKDRAAHYPAELSGGEQQRVALARALAPNPAILVAGYQSIMRTIYKPSEYYQRALDSLKRTAQEAKEPDHYNVFNAIASFTRIAIKLGILDSERREFWRFFATTAARHRNRFAESLRLAAMGYHFRKLNESYDG